MPTFESRSSRETEEIGATVGHGLAAGHCLGLCGDLGAGKTHFVKGLVAGLGGDPAGVSSPTFGLVHEYSGDGGRPTVYHFDFYRLDSADAVEEIGWDEYLAAGGVVVVEWAEKFAELLPPGTQWWEIVEKSPGSRLIFRHEGATGAVGVR